MAIFKKKKEEELKETEEEIEEIKKELKTETKTEKKVKWQVTEVATQTQPVLINTETNETIGVLSALALLLNKLEDIEEFLAT